MAPSPCDKLTHKGAHLTIQKDTRRQRKPVKARNLSAGPHRPSISNSVDGLASRKIKGSSPAKGKGKDWYQEASH